MHEWKYVSVAPGIILFCWVLTVSSHDETSSVLAHDTLKLCAHSDVEHPRHHAVNRQVLFGDGIVQETLLAWEACSNESTGCYPRSWSGCKDLDQDLRLTETNGLTSPRPSSPQQDARAELDSSLTPQGSASDAHDRLGVLQLSSSVSLPREHSGAAALLQDPVSNWNLDSDDIAIEHMAWSTVSSAEMQNKGETNMGERLRFVVKSSDPLDPWNESTRYCRDHAPADSVDFKHQKCRHAEGCSRQASWSDPCHQSLGFCAQHKLSGSYPKYGYLQMRADEKVFQNWTSLATFQSQSERRSKSPDEKRRRCEYPLGCKKIPAFGEAGDRPRFCVMHKCSKHVLIRKLCMVEGCCTRAVFGFHNRNGGLTHCEAHRRPGQKKIASYVCKSPLCTKVAKFGEVKGERRFCAEHREPHHVDLFNKHCKFPDCMRRASFGDKAERVPLWCAAHADRSTMVDVRHSKCIEKGCNLTPSFGLLTDGQILYCSKHKHSDCVNLRHLQTLAKGSLQAGGGRRARSSLMTL
ncbi:hypothetical protein GUITHDRAFT_162949 [Guillardia theta CCMP2712]|uniref:Uncharacterized protein n=1 Tax=Guillardia theta (strain CCMP2712) TaxID=905079 RepID=L1JDS8_GUITC|nr:hypothetical protein GUITHDRAFT_162949 [Guillardia theta CCMP2712]EKX46457.1 hypothetical protein GUITHDRAFT_162949 [Guillardia theta CCMP2712]|eukprot:XP_005833437.1 hypothetical protein GUITHDRAFT_162949 [Guillardia theta CCMP2712]